MAAIGTGLVVAMMIATISLTAFERQWIVFLSGFLAAAVFAFVSRSANSRWVIARRTAQVSSMRGRLATESRLREAAERSLARVSGTMHFVDVAMPAMLAYIDAGGTVRYHNHSYARESGLADSAIDGRQVRQILGATLHAEVEPYLAAAMSGQEVRYERTQEMPGGRVRLFVQYLPHFEKAGKVAGVFAILTDITRAKDLAPAPPAPAQLPGPEDVASKLVAALESDQFCLYSQSISPLGAAGDGASFCEVLLRLREEEENLLPPGCFLPIAEEHGLLPSIDRWVVRNVVRVGVASGAGNDARYFINVCAPTVAEGTLAPFVREQLEASGLGGSVLCLEFPEQDIVANPLPYRDLIVALSGSGCRFAASGVGRDLKRVRLLAQLGINYLKLDGGLVLNVLRDPAELDKVRAFNVAAHAAGMHVVAQCVEDDSTRIVLQAAGTDFAQGFGVSMPGPMEQQK
jgi:PAS domain S-box-containing protein